MRRTAFILAAILTVGLVSCDKSEKNDASESFDEIIRENVIGRKWKSVSQGNVQELTNLRNIMTFEDNSKLILSRSLNTHGNVWENHFQTKYSIIDSVISFVTSRVSEETGLHVISISPNEMLVRTNGNLKKYVNVTVDYSNAILGTWEGVELTGYETYGNAMHRWEYKADGTYVYYSKDQNGKWVPSFDILQEYNVDGDWLATRWMDSDSIEYREWWDIEKVDENEMIWTALRDTFETSFRMKRVK